MVIANRTLSRSKGRFPSSSKTSRSSGKTANAAGYAKRQARKPKSIHGLSSDVYEYAPEVQRRSKVTLDLNQDEAAEYGVGIDGGNDEDREQLRARLIGENGDNEGIDSGDDEEIDSDAAFEESDEERFAGFFSNKVRVWSISRVRLV
jgi:U3 small nucleolar RNA-associated protein 14